MTFLTVATPTISLANVIHPLVVLGFLGTFAIVLEPLLKGLLYAASLIVKSRKPSVERKSSVALQSIPTLAARDKKSGNSRMTAELHIVAARS
jgi:hypothetical protein